MAVFWFVGLDSMSNHTTVRRCEKTRLDGSLSAVSDHRLDVIEDHDPLFLLLHRVVLIVIAAAVGAGGGLCVWSLMWLWRSLGLSRYFWAGW